jgi:hypothetical protein
VTIFVTEEMLEREVAEFLAKRLSANVIEQGSLRRPRRQFDICSNWMASELSLKWRLERGGARLLKELSKPTITRNG